MGLSGLTSESNMRFPFESTTLRRVSSDPSSVKHYS